MATEKTLEILKKMKADPKAKELFDGMEKPKSPDEAISAYAQIAEKLGYGITADDIKEAVKQEESRRKAKTDKVVADMQELKDDDLEGVAGGYWCEDGCARTYSMFSLCDEVDFCYFSISNYECYNDYWGIAG